MKNVLRVSILSVLVGFVMSSTVLAQVTTGAKAPDFTLEATDGNNYSLSDYRGKYVVLEWLNHDCPFVKKHYNSGNMQNLQKEYAKKGVVWLSVNSSAHGKQGHYHSKEADQLTKQKGAAPTAVLMDADGDVGRMYGAKTTPHMYIIDPKGKLIYQGAIDSTPSADPQDIANSTNFVQMALDQSMKGQAVSSPSTKSYGCSVKY